MQSYSVIFDFPDFNTVRVEGNVINDGSLSIPERIDINEEEVEVTPFVMHNWITEVALSIKIKFPHCMLNKV